MKKKRKKVGGVFEKGGGECSEIRRKRGKKGTVGGMAGKKKRKTRKRKVAYNWQMTKFWDDPSSGQK